jgi:hypothetical protein
MSRDFRRTLILVAREGMGEGPPDLPLRLFASWCGLLLENRLVPGAMAFYGNGVKLTVDGSPVLGPLAELEAAGCHLVICKTCLDTFGLLSSTRVGTIGGMGDIQAAVALAEKVVAL